MLSSYHPPGDGQTEVVNRCLEGDLRCMVNDRPDTWMKWLSLNEWWYNTSHHSAINTASFDVFYGFSLPILIPYFPKDAFVTVVDSLLRNQEEVI